MAPYFPPWRRKPAQPKLGVEVITSNINSNPCCTHGPTICFERYFVNGKTRKYYACSACRDLKGCPFYLWADQKQTKISKAKWLTAIKESRPLRSHQDEYNRLSSLSSVSAEERGYCTVCNMLCLLPTDSEHKLTEKCSAETVITPITEHQLTHPSQLVPLKQASKCEAQYLFSDKSCSTVLSFVESLSVDSVLCIGVPSVHETLVNKKQSSTKSMLLDIDARYRSFYPPTSFVRFNLFNQHFFDGARARQRLVNFLSSSKKICVLCDPPFGARVELLAHLFEFIQKLYSEVHNSSDTLPVMLMFPYYSESLIVSAMPSFSMLDYKLEYSNHNVFTSGTKKAMKQGSGVRVFTNSSPSAFTFPTDEGYKHCSDCDKWVYKENSHCHKCGGCMGKDGTGYTHCDTCDTCVKSTWKHCDKCSKCLATSHTCNTLPPLDFVVAQKKSLANVCHVCGEGGHRRKDCPNKQNDQNKRKMESELTPKNMKKRKKTDKSIPVTRKEEKAQYMNLINSILAPNSS